MLSASVSLWGEKFKLSYNRELWQKDFHFKLSEKSKTCLDWTQTSPIFRGNKYIFNIWMCVKGESKLTWRSSCLIIISSGWQQEELCSTGLMKDTEKLFTFLCFALGLFSLLLPLSLPLSVSLSHPLIIYRRCHRSERAACVCLTRCSCISFNKDMSLITNVSHRQEDTLANCKLTPEWWQAMLSCLVVSHECVMR